MNNNTKSNIHGNTSFTVTQELAKALMLWSGYEGYLPPVDIADYDNPKNYPYPLSMDLYEVIKLLSSFDIETDKEWERALSRAEVADNEEDDDEDEIPHSKKELLETVIGPFRSRIISYIFVCNQKWIADADVEQIPFDWLFAYLWSLSKATGSAAFAFITEDEFGETVSPIQIQRVRFSKGGMMTPPHIEVSYKSYHIFGKDKYMKMQHQLKIPLSPSVDFEKTTFLRGFDVNILAERNQKIIDLMGESCDAPHLIPGKEDRAFHLKAGGRGLVMQNTSGQYLFLPEVTEEHYDMYHFIDDCYADRVSDTEGFETWWYSRIVSAWHLQTRQGVLIAGDWLTKTVYDRDKINKLFLEPAAQMNIEALCHSVKTKDTYQDPFRGKSSNLVLLLGVPGTGKTSSIMGISSYFETPLIHISIADCGYSQISSYMERILHLANAFGAYVLVDEADSLIFKRGIEAMQRTEVVTQVLKVLEDYDGICFFTSNIEEKDIDPAIKSRLTAWIHFPSPSFDQVRTVWKDSLASIDFSIEDSTLDRLAQATVDNEGDLRGVTKSVAHLYAIRKYRPEQAINIFDFVR